MNLEPCPLKDAAIISPKVFGDERGFFMETWNRESFAELGLDLDFKQDNHSRSRRGILRGLHYQTEQTQGKLVRVIAGEVYDVIVDLRRASDTFGQHFGVTLSSENKLMLWVPPGFAHGFYVCSETAEVVYKCTELYHPESEVSIRWDDPELNIAWPLYCNEAPELSNKDAAGLDFSAAPKM